MGFFFFCWGGGGVNFGPGIFLGFVGSPRDFCGFRLLPPCQSSPSLEIRSTPLGLT